MKKLLLLFLISLVFTSCSSDDSSSGSSNDDIVGKWYWGAEVYILADNSEVEIDNGVCMTQSSTEFKSDGTLEQISYYENNTGGCDLETVVLEYGYWEKLSNGNYKLTSKYPNENEEVSIEEIEFISSTQFRYIEYDAGFYDGQNIDIEYEYRNK